MTNKRGLGDASVLITGGAGFIGSHLADLVVADGATVRVIDDLSTGSLDNLQRLTGHQRFTFHAGDVRDETLLRKAMDGCTMVFHLAAVVGVKKVLEDPLNVVEANIAGTKTVLEAARRTGASVFVASTSEIYGKNEAVPFTEDSDRVLGPPQVARWSYSVSKAADELLAFGYAQEHGLHVVVGRFFNTIGRRQVGHYGMVVPSFVRQALAGEPLTVYGSGEQTRTFCDVRDVVHAMTLLMSNPDARGLPFNIGGTREISIRDLACLVLENVGGGDCAARIRTLSYDEAYDGGYDEFPRRVPDISRIRSLTGWEPRRSLEDTLLWIRDEFARDEDAAA